MKCCHAMLCYAMCCAVQARQDRHLTEAEYNELIRQHAEHHQDFSNVSLQAMLRHQP